METRLMKALILTDKLSKFYGSGVKAVDELDLEVYKGETFGLLGPNGAGKTTTIRLLNCIMKPTSGKATVNGYDIIKDDREVKKKGHRITRRVPRIIREVKFL
jgi:ABC-2 type transport system ATP-binding protein